MHMSKCSCPVLTFRDRSFLMIMAVLDHRSRMDERYDVAHPRPQAHTLINVTLPNTQVERINSLIMFTHQMTINLATKQTFFIFNPECSYRTQKVLVTKTK